MIDSILTAAGVTHKETVFRQPPKTTYAVWFDDITTDGPDGINAILTHEYTVELYSYSPDPTSEAAIEAAIDEEGLRWVKQPRYWLTTEQVYQTIYNITYIEKRRII